MFETFATRDTALSRAIWRACPPPGEIRVRPLADFLEPAVVAEDSDFDDDAASARRFVRSPER